MCPGSVSDQLGGIELHVRGRAGLEREVAVPEAFEFGVDLKNMGPGIVWLSLFSEVCPRRGKFCQFGK